MPMTYAELKARLDVDEPDYAALAESIGRDAMKHLRRMAASADASLASKAVSLAGIVGDDDSVGVVADAARSPDALVRAAAAHASTMLPDSAAAAKVIATLLDDQDLGVVKFASRAVARQSSPQLAAKSRRAAARVATLARSAAKENERRERSTAMASRKHQKSAAMPSARASGKGTGRAGPRAGEMPQGKMSDRPAAKATAEMPSGKME